ncbi:MAG: hypothetical protein L3J52_05525 [Proteobacteria bacterium]|nr:hypothetical protein [Pseudomonadota bacterium]
MKEPEHIIDPSFLRTSNYSYVNYNNKKLASLLCFSLTRHKQDLILHQQRIELFANNKNRTLLFSALVDLFTTLESGGTDYKKRMLSKHKDLISIEQTTILTEALSTNLSATTCINGLKESVMNVGLQGEVLSSMHINHS